MTVNVNPLDKRSIADAIRLVEAFKKKSSLNREVLLRRLAEVGKAAAEAAIAAAWVTYVHPPDAVPPGVVIDYSEIEKGHVALHMVGDHAGFLEFGTSVDRPEYQPKMVKGYTPPPHGSYGKGGGQRKDDGEPASWVVPFTHGKISFGNAPAYAMDSAMIAMTQQYDGIVKEVYGR